MDRMAAPKRLSELEASTLIAADFLIDPSDALAPPAAQAR